MEFRFLGNSGLKVSAISYGNRVTYGSQVEADQATACVRAALEGQRSVLTLAAGLTLQFFGVQLLAWCFGVVASGPDAEAFPVGFGCITAFSDDTAAAAHPRC
jgi:hypothetical protein